MILLQSCAGVVGGALAEKEEMAGAGGIGIIVSLLMLAGGIVSIVSRKGGSNIALMIIFGLGALLGFVGSTGGFSDLLIWGGWCLVCAVLAYVDKRNKKVSDKE